MSFTITTPFYQYLAHVGLKPLKIIKCCVEASGAESVSTFFRTLGENHQSFDSLRHLALWRVLGATWRATGSMPNALPECGAEVRLFAAVLGDANVATVRALMAAASGAGDVRDQLLHYAQSAEMVLFLVNEVGCLVDAPLLRGGHTPLQSAMLSGNVALARQLVDVGASGAPEVGAMLATTPRTALQVALCKISLVACGSGESPLRVAIQLLLDSRGDLLDNVLRVLLDDGNEPGEKLLVWLAGVGGDGAVRLMVRLLVYAPQSEETVNRARSTCTDTVVACLSSMQFFTRR